ncbi:Inner membrane protein [Kosakonia sp. BK9b]
MSTANNYDYQNDHSLSEKWKYRFAFYDKNGLPSFWGQSPAWKEAYKEMTFGQKIKVSMNFFAYFFSIIYLLILGLWKKAILVLLLNIVVIAIILITDMNFLGYVVNIFTAMRANIWYYELKVKGVQTWNL